MTQTQIDWQAARELPMTGRAVSISDGYYTSYAAIPEDMTLEEACDEYAATYDRNGAPGEIVADGTLYVDGVNVPGEAGGRVFRF